MIAILVALITGGAVFLAMLSIQRARLDAVARTLRSKLDSFLADQQSKGALDRIGFTLSGSTMVHEKLERVDNRVVIAHLCRIYETREHSFFWCLCGPEFTPIVRQISADRARQVMRWS